MSTLHAYIHTGLIPLTHSVKEEVSSINGSSRSQMGKSEKQLKACVFNTRHPRTQPRDKTEVHSSPELPTSLQVCKYEMVSPSPPLWPPSWEHLSLPGIPKLPALEGPALPRGPVLGQAMEQERGLAPFPARVA